MERLRNAGSWCPGCAAAPQAACHSDATPPLLDMSLAGRVPCSVLNCFVSVRAILKPRSLVRPPERPPVGGGGMGLRASARNTGRMHTPRGNLPGRLAAARRCSFFRMADWRKSEGSFLLSSLLASRYRPYFHNVSMLASPF